MNSHYASSSFLMDQKKPSPREQEDEEQSLSKEFQRKVLIQKRPSELQEEAQYQANYNAFVQRVTKTEDVEIIDKPRVSLKQLKSVTEEVLRQTLPKVHKVQLKRIIEDAGPKESGKKTRKFFFQGFSENLNGISKEEQIFEFMRFQGCEATTSFTIGVGKGIENLDELAKREIYENEGMEVKELIGIRDKLIDVDLITEKGSQPLGKTEYKRWKFRVYDVYKKLIFKIVKTESAEKSKVLTIRDANRKAVGTIHVAHKNNDFVKGELEFPKETDFIKRLLLISVLFSVMDRVRPLNERESAVEKFFGKKMFGILSCAPQNLSENKKS